MKPALWATGGVVVTALVIAWRLVREHTAGNGRTGGGGTAPPRRRLREAFQLDLRHHRPFAWLIAARFLFLLGTYAVGRFFLFFVAQRLDLEAAEAAAQAGGLLAVLTLITALSAPVSGWAADRLGRVPLMLAGAGLSAVGTLLLVFAEGPAGILMFGGLMALGSAAFSSANWAFSADLAPPEEAARFLGLANFGTAGAVAAAGLFGPLVDGLNHVEPGLGYSALFVSAAALALLSGVAAARVGRVAPAGRPAAPMASLRPPVQSSEG
jgi:MFS family permease